MAMNDKDCALILDIKRLIEYKTEQLEAIMTRTEKQATKAEFTSLVNSTRLLNEACVALVEFT
jgi:hypothetical protein